MSYQAIPIGEAVPYATSEKESMSRPAPLYVLRDPDPSVCGLRKSTWRFLIGLSLIAGLFFFYPTTPAYESRCPSLRQPHHKSGKHRSPNDAVLSSDFLALGGECSGNERVKYGGQEDFTFDSTKLKGVTIRSKSQFITGDINVEVDSSLLGVIVPKNATVTPNIMVDKEILDEKVVKITESFDVDKGYIMEIDTPDWNTLNGKSNCVFVNMVVKLPKYHSALKFAKFENVDGSVKMHRFDDLELDNLDLKTTDGELAVNSLKVQHLTMTNVNGDINVKPSAEIVVQSANIQDTSGNINIKDLKATQFTVTNMNGPINLEHSTAINLCKVSSTNGEINGNLNLNDRTIAAHFETTKGNINLQLADSFVGKFNLRNFMGTIQVKDDKNNLQYEENNKHSKTGTVGEFNEADNVGTIDIVSVDANISVDFVAWA